MRCCLRRMVWRVDSVGMRHEDRLDAQRAEQFEHLLQLQPARLEGRDGVLDAAGLRPLAVLQEILASPADAVDLLRQIDRLEPGGERADQVARQRGRTAAHRVAELRLPARLAIAALDRGDAVVLDQLE